MKKLIIILFSIPFFLLAQNKLSTEVLWQFGRLSDPQISPNGQTVIYGVKTYDVKANKGSNIIYAKPISGGEAKAITEAKTNASGARFTPDGKKISYLSTESPVPGQAAGDMQLWEMNVDGSDKKQITVFPGGISGYKYSPKMTQLAYTADVKLDKAAKEIYPDLDKTNARIIDNLLYRHWDSWHDYAYSHLFIVGYAQGSIIGNPTDLLAGERFDCPLTPFGDDDEYNWSADGTKIAYDSKKLFGTQDAVSTNSDIYLYDLNTKITRNISESNTGYDRNPQFSPDGTKLAWLSVATPACESARNTLVMHDLSKENGVVPSQNEIPKITKISDQFDYPVDNFKWADDGKMIFGIVTENATKHIVGFWPDQRGFASYLFTGDFDVNEFSMNGKSSKAIFIANTSRINSPNVLFKYEFAYSKPDLKDKKLSGGEVFENPNQSLLNATKMGEVRKRMVKTTDGKDMLVWVIYPPDFDAGKKYPTLLYCQGGPQSTVSQFFSYRWNFQLMAANGYIVVAPNRRGLPGFGSEWNEEISGDYGGQCMKDYLSAIDEVAKEPYVNKDKLGAVGASFGGYSVYWLAGNHNKRFKAFIAHCGMFNMESWYGTTEEMYFANYDNKGPYWSQTGSSNNYESSPHKFIKNWDTPILIIHNEKDFRVPLGQGMEAFTAAQIKGVPSRFLYFPDEGHWVTKPQNSILWQRVFFEWLDTYLK